MFFFSSKAGDKIDLTGSSQCEKRSNALGGLLLLTLVSAVVACTLGKDPHYVMCMISFWRERIVIIPLYKRKNIIEKQNVFSLKKKGGGAKTEFGGRGRERRQNTQGS